MQQSKWTTVFRNPYKLQISGDKNMLFIFPLLNILEYNEIFYSLILCMELDIYTSFQTKVAMQQSKWTTVCRNPYKLWMSKDKNILFLFFAPKHIYNVFKQKQLCSSQNEQQYVGILTSYACLVTRTYYFFSPLPNTLEHKQIIDDMHGTGHIHNLFN